MHQPVRAICAGILLDRTLFTGQCERVSGIQHPWHGGIYSFTSCQWRHCHDGTKKTCDNNIRDIMAVNGFSRSAHPKIRPNLFEYVPTLGMHSTNDCLALPIGVVALYLHQWRIQRGSDSFTILGLWVLGLTVSNINESQLQIYESKSLFLMTSLQYCCIPGLAWTRWNKNLCAKDAGCAGNKITGGGLLETPLPTPVLHIQWKWINLVSQSVRPNYFILIGHLRKMKIEIKPAKRVATPLYIWTSLSRNPGSAPVHNRFSWSWFLSIYFDQSIYLDRSIEIEWDWIRLRIIFVRIQNCKIILRQGWRGS